MVNSLEGRQDGGDIRTVRRKFGIKVKEQLLRRADFMKFTTKATSTTQSGSKHVIRYSIYAVDRSGKKVVMGEGFNGVGEADAAVEFIGQQFGLSAQRPARTVETPVEGYNFLAAD